MKTLAEQQHSFAGLVGRMQMPSTTYRRNAEIAIDPRSDESIIERAWRTMITESIFIADPAAAPPDVNATVSELSIAFGRLTGTPDGRARINAAFFRPLGAIEMGYFELREQVAVILSGGSTQMTAAELTVIIGEVSDRVNDLDQRIGDERDSISDPTPSIEDGVQAATDIVVYVVEKLKLRVTLEQLTEIRNRKNSQEIAAHKAKADADSIWAFKFADSELASVLQHHLSAVLTALEKAKMANDVARQRNLPAVDPDDVFGGSIAASQFIVAGKEALKNTTPGARPKRQ